jgi:hypothetical protein
MRRPEGFRTPVGHAATRLPDARVLVVGGWTIGTRYALAEIFDPASENFSTVPGPDERGRKAHTILQLDDGNMGIVEVSVEPGKFERSHIPGTVKFRWDTDLVDPVRRNIASRENWEKLLSSVGITPETTVVLYGDQNKCSRPGARGTSGTTGTSM